MHIFVGNLLNAEQARLSAEEAQHCVRVMRYAPGDTIFCIDMEGKGFDAEIISADKQGANLKVLAIYENWGEHPYTLRLAVSPLRQKERLEWLLEKAVELGVTEIIPIICKHSITDNVKPERVKSLLIAALKQCKRSRLPELKPAISLEKWLKQSALSGQKLIAYCEEARPIQTVLQQDTQEISLMIGPEGDFTAQEVEAAKAAGFTAVSLGATRLRTETAGIYALSAIKYQLNY